MFKDSPMEKAWFRAPVEHSFNRKSIMTAMEYTPVVYRPKEEDMDL